MRNNSITNAKPTAKSYWNYSWTFQAC